MIQALTAPTVYHALMGLGAVKLGVVYFYPITYFGWRKRNPRFLEYGCDGVDKLHDSQPSHKESEVTQKKLTRVSPAILWPPQVPRFLLAIVYTR